MGYRCLFCYVDLKDEGDRIGLIKSENISWGQSSSPVLEQQVKVIFILRKLLEIPEVKLISFLEDLSSNPSEWIRLCGECEEIVENARRIYGEILEVQRRFRGVQQRIIEVTKGSCYGDGGGARESTGKHGRRAVSQDSVVMGVTNECRAVILDRPDQFGLLVDNPFIEGDLMAETAVIAGLEKRSRSAKLIIPVKDEAVSEEESDSIFPPDHFDDSSTEVPEEMQMKCKIREDNDDEWVPDPLESNNPPKRKSPRSKVVPKAKPNQISQGSCGRSTVECPVCQNFKCKVDEGEQLCEHLEFCTEKRWKQNKDCLLTCPVCRKFTIDIGNKVEFAEHMSWCYAISQSSGAELDDHESSLLRWKIFSCDTCGEKGKRKFMKIDEFVDHLILHIRCPFKCIRCPHRFKIGASQYNFHHYKAKHPDFLKLQPASSRCVFDGNLPKYFWWCPVEKCPEKFTTHNLRDEHIQHEHRNSCQNIQSKKSIICGTCSSAFFSVSELKLHNATSHVLVEQDQQRIEKPVQNQERKKPAPKRQDIMTKRRQRQLLRKQEQIKRKVSSSLSSNSDSAMMSKDDEEGARSNVKSSRKSHKPISIEQGYSRKEFQEILTIARSEKELKKRTQSLMFCPHCNTFPLKVHQLVNALDHIKTCPAALLDSEGVKTCPVCLVQNFQMETQTVEYVEHVTSCKKKDGDGNCFIPLQNRLFKCTTCAEDEKKWMQADDFLEHYIFHLRYRYKCTHCSNPHRFVTNTSKGTHYHYKTLHPDKLIIPPDKRCTLEFDLPELCWWCPVCSQKFSDDNERNVHFNQYHPEEYNDLQAHKDNFKCQWCSQSYFCADELRYHQGTRHVYDERKRTGRSEPKKGLVFGNLPSQKSKTEKLTSKPRRSYVETCYFKPSSSVGSTMINAKPVVALSSSSSDFLTKLQFREFLRNHFKQFIPEQNDKKLFTCNICPDREAMDLAAFLDHYLFHKRMTFKCTKCSHRFPSNYAQDTNYHYKTIHPEHWSEPGSTRCVEDPVLPELVWVCIYCKEEYPSEHLRDSHLETEHPDKLGEEKSQPCQLCSKKYSSSEELLMHIGTTHVIVKKLLRKERRYKCNACMETFEKWKDYRKHCRTVHKVGDDGDDSNDEDDPDSVQAARVICDVCGKEVKNAYLKRHSRLHCVKRIKKFKCDVPGCGESFTTGEFLGLHKFRKHESRDPEKNPLVCPYCPWGEKVFHNRYYLRMHIQAVHHKKFNMQCDICGKGFLVKSQLLRHLSRIHHIGTLGQLKCPIEGCGKILYRKEQMEEHLSKHEGKPKHNCRFCGKEFYFRKGLQRHELIHENAESKPYQCEICDKRFPVSNYLYIHMRSHKRKGEVQ